MLSEQDAAMDVNEAFFAAKRLYDDLSRLADRDPEQELLGTAVVTADAVLTACRKQLPGHAIVSELPEIISPEAAKDGDSPRVADVLTVVGQVMQALSAERSRRQAMEIPAI